MNQTNQLREPHYNITNCDLKQKQYVQKVQDRELNSFSEKELQSHEALQTVYLN